MFDDIVEISHFMYFYTNCVHCDVTCGSSVLLCDDVNCYITRLVLFDYERHANNLFNSSVKWNQKMSYFKVPTS